LADILIKTADVARLRHCGEMDSAYDPACPGNVATRQVAELNGHQVFAGTDRTNGVSQCNIH